MSDRRDFLKKTGIAAGAIAASGAFRTAEAAASALTTPAALPTSVPPPMDAATKELLMEALNTAKLAGASYADARIARYRDNQIFTREQQIINVVDQDSMGCGVRALVDGTWGFAATPAFVSVRVAEKPQVPSTSARTPHPIKSWSTTLMICCSRVKIWLSR